MGLYEGGYGEEMQEKIEDLIAALMKVRTEDISGVCTLKKGMTNRSFLFTCQGKDYIIRVPGEGTDRLINRRQEAEVYDVINHEGISDEVIYIDSTYGYKISRFWESARVCNPFCVADVRLCMQKLRAFHCKGFQVKHEFDIFGQIQFYENLWAKRPTGYRDYETVKEKVFSLGGYIDRYIEKKVLAHIDAVPDNFLFILDENKKEEIRLIDWEYAGMQDPHVDIAMFCIYSMYDRRQADWLIDLYFEEGCAKEIRAKIYCYIAACGLLWSNWCEYKRQLGVEFGGYASAQYRFAEEYYQIAQESMK